MVDEWLIPLKDNSQIMLIVQCDTRSGHGFFICYSYGFFVIFLQINGVDVRDITHNEALDLVRKGKGGRLKLVVQKRAIQVHNPHSSESVVVRLKTHKNPFAKITFFFIGH